MTDAITPASLRAHADHFAGRWHLVSEALIDEAARLEAESARAELVGKLAQKVYEVAPQLGAFQEVFDVARAVLDFLAADGRLLPEGATVLTADEGTLHRVYAALGNAGLSHRVAEDAVNEMQNLGILFRERTSSESPNGLDFDVPPAVAVPDSGPDGTPEKPWPTWQDVPEGVKYRSRDEHADVIGNWWWWNQKGIRYTENECGHPRASKTSEERMTNHYAPFVRVDGDKA